VGKHKRLSQPEPRLISFVLMSVEANGEKKTGLVRIILIGMMRLGLNHAKVAVKSSVRKRQKQYPHLGTGSFALSLALTNTVLDTLDRITLIGGKIQGVIIVADSIRNGEIL